MKKGVGKKCIVLGIVMLLFIIIPIGNAYTTSKNEPLKTTVNNYLGRIEVVHGSPLIFAPFTTVSFEPVEPEERYYSFPEHNGTVKMNFTITIAHRLANNYPIPRTTNWACFIEDFIGPTTYMKNGTRIPCTSVNWEEINWTLTYTGEYPEFPTHGQNKTLTVLWLTNVWFFGIIPTPWKGAHYRFGEWKGPQGSIFDITIHPIVTP